MRRYIEMFVMYLFKRIQTQLLSLINTFCQYVLGFDIITVLLRVRHLEEKLLMKEQELHEVHIQILSLHSRVNTLIESREEFVMIR